MSDLLRPAILQDQVAEPADLVLKGGRFLDLVSGDLVSSDIATTGNRIVVVRDGALLAELALRIAGLMSDRSFEAVQDTLIPLRQAAKSLGAVLPEPFLQVALLPLPVIPHLKISDRGLVDVELFGPASLAPASRPQASCRSSVGTRG